MMSKLQLPMMFAIPGAVLYGLAVSARLRLYRWKLLSSHRLKNPVLSIGNITVGGTGKTPLTESIGRLLHEKGLAVSILSRGYGRKSRGTIPVGRGHGPICAPDVCGDEPFLLARNLPECWVTVGEDRFQAGQAVEKELTQCIHILDDGYQHLRLQRSANILLLDATNPFGNSRLLPWGILREPLSALNRADLIVITRADHSFEEAPLISKIKQIHARVPVLYAYTQVQGLVEMKSGSMHPVQEFFRKKVAAFAGIAQPALFFQDLVHYQMEIVLRREFADHHKYCQPEIDLLLEESRRAEASMLVTTEKDAINMLGLRCEDFPSFYLRIQSRFAQDSQPLDYIEGLLAS